MKTIMLILSGAVMLHVNAGAQDVSREQVPSVILNAFQSAFAEAKDVEWEIKGDLYKAEFEVGTREHDAWFDKSGNIKKHKEDFPKSELPSAVRQKVETDFKEYTIDDADKIEENGQVLYQLDLDANSGERKVLITESGELKANDPD